MPAHFSALTPLTLLALAAALPAPAEAAPGDVLAPTKLASHNLVGQGGDSWSIDPWISADGRFVAFSSDAEDLVPNDTNGTYDVFVSDMLLGTVELITVSAAGGPSNGPSGQPSISADGRYVCFESGTTNLISPPSSGMFAIYVRDRLTGTTELVSRNDAGVEANNTTELSTISPDGRFVAFASYADNLFPGHPVAQFRDIYVRDLAAQTTVLVSKSSTGGFANSSSFRAKFSGDGRLVAFFSQADNLVAPGTTQGRLHVYVHDRQTGLTTIASAEAGGAEANGDSYAPSLSADGRFVAFETYSTNILPAPGGSRIVILRDLTNGAILDVNFDSLGNPLAFGAWNPWLSTDGRFVSFITGPVLHNCGSGLYVRDRQLGKTIAACSKHDGDGTMTVGAYAGAISADGTTVAIASTGQLTAASVMAQGDIYVRGMGSPLAYCDGKVNSAGCKPAIGFSGEARVGNNFDLDVTCTGVLNSKVGLLLHSIAGPQQTSFFGGILCVAPPVARTNPANSGGTPPPAIDCSGVWSVNLGTELATSPIGGAVGLGSVLCLQWWGRDPFQPPTSAVQLSNALQVVIGP